MSRTLLTLLGVQIDTITRTAARNRLREIVTNNTFQYVVTPGPEFLLEATANPLFRRVLNEADLSLPDGMGLRVGAWLTGQRFQGRVTGVDFVEDVLSQANESGLSVFLFGSTPGTVNRAAMNIMKRWPRVRLVGIESGRRFHQRLNDRRIIQSIHRVKPEILLVALGAPKQELWIYQHRHQLHHVRLAVGVGRTLDYLAGTIRRPPVMVRRLGMEWLYTYLFANRFYQPEFRRQRVRNATWHFVKTVWRHRYER